jgi:hypothetical protein
MDNLWLSTLPGRVHASYGSCQLPVVTLNCFPISEMLQARRLGALTADPWHASFVWIGGIKGEKCCTIRFRFDDGVDGSYLDEQLSIDNLNMPQRCF